MKRIMVASALAFCIALPAAPAKAGLFDDFFGWVKNTFSTVKKKRAKQKQQTQQRTAVTAHEQRTIANQIMPSQYGSYNRSKECWGSNCMSVNFINRIRFTDGDIYYMLTAASNEKTYDMFALRHEAGHYRILAKRHYQGMGFSGDGMFVQLGRSAYGWNLMTGDKGGMSLYEDYYIFVDDEIKHVASIQDFSRSGVSNNGHVLSGDIQVGQGNGFFYPLEVKVTGLTHARITCNSCEPRGGKRMSPKYYRFEYNKETGRYEMPAGYPMKGQRF
jgi:hypothetical protein